MERFPLPSEPRLMFGPDGAVDGFDGCDEWSDVVDVSDGRILRTPTGAAPISTVWFGSAADNSTTFRS